jgi:hypothetical protein
LRIRPDEKQQMILMAVRENVTSERELAEIEATRAHVAGSRSIGELDALIAAALSQPVIANERVRGTVARLSSDCHAPDVRTTEACAVVARLRSERAAAQEAARLQERARALRLEIARLRDAGSASPPDPVGEFYAWATRGLLSVRDVGFGFPLFFALMIEVVTAFGPVTVVRFAELSAASTTGSTTGATWRAATDHVEARPAIGLLADGLEDRVAVWMSARATPRSDGGATTLGDLHRDFDAWCLAEPRCDATSLARAFDRLREMPELRGKIRKFGTRYYGVKLADAQPRLVN